MGLVPMGLVDLSLIDSGKQRSPSTPLAPAPLSSIGNTCNRQYNIMIRVLGYTLKDAYIRVWLLLASLTFPAPCCLHRTMSGAARKPRVSCLGRSLSRPWRPSVGNLNQLRAERNPNPGAQCEDGVLQGHTLGYSRATYQLTMWRLPQPMQPFTGGAWHTGPGLT